MGPIRLRRVFSSDFGINGAPAKQMGELVEEEGVLTSPGKQMFFYVTQRPSHDGAASLNPGEKSTTSYSDYQRLTSQRRSPIRTLCVRAGGHRKCQQKTCQIKKE